MDRDHEISLHIIKMHKTFFTLIRLKPLQNHFGEENERFRTVLKRILSHKYEYP